MEKYSQEKGNLQIIPKPKMLEVLTKERRVLGRSKKMRWITDSTLIIIVAIILILGVSYLVRSYNIGKNIFLDAKTVSLKVISGNLETFELDYKNDNKETIYNTSVALELPGNFVLKEVLPTDIFDEHTNTINLGDLVSGANGKIKIRGYVLGEVGVQQFMKFSFNYTKDGFNRKCQNVLAYLIEDSVLNIDISLPTEIYQEVPFTDQLVLHNQGQQDLENIKINFDENIEIRGIDNYEGINFDIHNIYINQLSPNEKIFLNLDLLVENVQGQTKFDFGSEINGLKQKTIQKESQVEVPGFKINVFAQQKQISMGEYLDFKVNYQNNEQERIKNISLDFQPTSNFLIKDFILEDQTRFTSQGHTISFKNSLAPQESGSFSIKVLFERNKMELNQRVGLLVNTKYNYQNKNISYTNYSAVVKLCSNVNIKSSGYYYSPQGDQLGTGPLPPMVDIPTNYWIFWEVDNFGNDLSSFSMSADLPEGLVWTNNKSVLQGNLQYGENSRRVIWNINDIPAQSENYKARFEVGLIPEEKDIGEVLDLLENIKFSVQDNFCGSQISGNKGNIDTNLKDDDLVSGKGKVIDFK